MMRMPALLSIVLLGVGLTACAGGAHTVSDQPTGTGANGSTTTTTASYAKSSGGYLKYDGDKDSDDLAHNSERSVNDEKGFLAIYGGEANQTDARTIASVVKGYYAALAAGDGAKACTLLDHSLATDLDENAARSGGGSCATYLHGLPEEQQRQLKEEEVSTMVVFGVHVKGGQGVALLGFRHAAEGEILVEREGRAWKIGAVLGGQMP